MSLTTEQQNEIAQFPAVLKALVEAELAAGNAIVEVGHSHPAPPAGAYCKLANKVSTRPRAAGGGLDFYERNSSSHSGEFTDAKRFFFVLEPPNPPPPEPDMDAIRKSLEPKPSPIAQHAQRDAPVFVGIARNTPTRSRKKAPAQQGTRQKSPATKAPAADQAIINTETPAGRRHLLHFRDPRPPHEIQFALERQLMSLFAATLTRGQLHLRAKANVNGADYKFELCLLAALPAENYYSLRTEVSWPSPSSANDDYFRKTSNSWIQLWTRELTPANPPAPDSGSMELYEQLCQAALHAEAHLDSVAAVQQAVIAGLKRGGSFANSHKEGGTNITWRMDRFVRSDYGDDPDLKEYRDEAEFLTVLRQFCSFDLTRHAGKEQRSELDTWKLILRRMSPP